MALARLRRISYLFPTGPAEARRFFVDLQTLLEGVPGCRVGGSGLTVPVTPGAALPGTAFVSTDTPAPAILFAADLPLALDLGGLRLYSTATGLSPTPASEGESALPSEAGVGETAPMALADLVGRLQGHITRLDHTGVVLPGHRLPRPAWERLILGLAGVAALYRYPTGEDWPFILPTTPDEYAADITDFSTAREPKFELVYAADFAHPLIQIDLETDLAMDEIAALLPSSTALPGLEAYFRSVYLATPWPGLGLRCDLRPRSDSPSGWDTGAWLVTEGGRIAAG